MIHKTIDKSNGQINCIIDLTEVDAVAIISKSSDVNKYRVAFKSGAVMEVKSVALLAQYDQYLETQNRKGKICQIQKK